MNKPVPPPRVLDISIPPEVKEAATLVETWFSAQHIQGWALQGLCSRKYFEAVQRHAPALRKLKQHTNGISVIRVLLHNSAVDALRELIMVKSSRPTELPHQD